MTRFPARQGMSRSTIYVALLASIAMVVGAVAPVAAFVREGGTPNAATTGRYIVVLDEPSLARYEGGIGSLSPTSIEVTGANRLDVGTAASVAYLSHLDARQDAVIGAAGAALGRTLDVFGRYSVTLNGFAAEMSAAEASSVAGLGGVSRVVADANRYLMTDNGPEWIGAPGIWDGSESGGTGTKGEGIVIGVIDTGVNHDHPSFADIGGDGYNHSNPRHRFFGVCNPGNGAPFCNDKLIGIYDFTGTSPFDDNGHGSHTASTSGGNVLTAEMVAPTITLERPLSGVAPHANLITYKACVTTPAAGTCPISALIAAIDQATADAVDVVNFSIGGGSSDPWGDLDAQAMLNGRAAGVFFSVSAGNEGPGASTVGSPADAPWVLSVGASTHDRRFATSLVDMAGGGSAPPADIEGKSLTTGLGTAPIVYAGDYGSALCGAGPANEATGEAAINPFTPGTFSGEIVVCDRGTYGRVEKGQNVMEGGAGGYVLANDEANGKSLIGDPYPLPGVHITYADGITLKAWIASGTGHTAAISGTLAIESPDAADVMASFSSRGPNPATGDLLKPDVTAPGVDILAAFNTPLGGSGDPVEWGVISGTSMSSPHAAGSAALLRDLHPDWTPAEVQSAMVSSAFTSPPGDGTETHAVLKEDGVTPADPFDMGGGRVNLHDAGRVALVLNETAAGYTAADPASGGDPSAINQASMASDGCAGTCAWTRTVRSTAGGPVTWTAAVVAPAGMALTISPATFTLNAGAQQTLQVTADVSNLTADAWAFARVFLIADQAGIPDVVLPLAAFVTGGSGAARTTLHFHGNSGVHASGEAAEADCTGNGAADLTFCGGPFLLESSELASGPAAGFGPNAVVLDCTNDRCEVDPNWVWNLTEPTTLEGPMTVEWWYGCPGCNVALFEDFFIRLWADGALVLEERVRHTQLAPGAPVRLSDTVTVPEVTANNTFVLQIDSIFINQDQSIVYYDSTQACPGGTAGPCDSLVRMPVVPQLPARADLVISDITTQTGTGGGTQNGKPRQGDKVSVVAEVTNQGDADAVATVTAFALDTASMTDSPVQTDPIPAGGFITVTLTWDTRGVSGEHDITVTADSGGAVVEEDEGNNSATLHVT
ncbi:MAG: S8 family serine peptidase, partial [Candidatus Limnocylindria bacterium]